MIATGPPRIGNVARLAICARAAASTGTPSVHIRTLSMIAGVAGVMALKMTKVTTT